MIKFTNLKILGSETKAKLAGLKTAEHRKRGRCQGDLQERACVYHGNCDCGSWRKAR